MEVELWQLLWFFQILESELYTSKPLKSSTPEIWFDTWKQMFLKSHMLLLLYINTHYSIYNNYENGNIFQLIVLSMY